MRLLFGREELRGTVLRASKVAGEPVVQKVRFTNVKSRYAHKHALLNAPTSRRHVGTACPLVYLPRELRPLGGRDKQSRVDGSLSPHVTRNW